MRKLLIIFIVIAVLLLLPLGLMRSERSLLFLAYWAIDNFTEFRLELKKPVLRPLAGRISASEIHLYPKADDGPPFVSVLDFSGDVNAADIYRGNLAHSQLRAGQVTIYSSKNDQTSDPAPMEWLEYLSWLPTQLSVGQLHVVTVSHNTLIFPLRELNGHRYDGKSFRATAGAQYEGEPLDIVLNIIALREQEQTTGIDVAANFSAPGTGSEIELRGELRGSLQDVTYNFHLDADYRKVERFLEGFNSRNRLRGALTVRANMSGNTDGFELSDALFELNNMPEYGVEAHGEMNYRFDGQSSISLQSAGELNSMEAMAQWLDIDLRPFGRALASAKIRGSLANPVIEDLILRSENSNGLVVNLRGSLNLQRGDLEKNRVRIDAHGPALSTLSQWTGPLPHEPGAFTVSGLIIKADTGLRVDNLIAELGSDQDLLLRLEGQATTGDLSQAQGLEALESVDLTLSVYSPDSRHLSPYVPAGLPAGFEVTGNVSIVGTGPKLQIESGVIKAESSDIVASLTPTSGTLRPQQEQLLSNFSGDISVYLSDTSALSQFFSTPVPVLGEVAGTGQIIQNQQSFSLQNIQIAMESEGAKLKTKGKIADLAHLDGLSLRGEYSGIRSNDLLSTAFQSFNYSGDLAEFHGSFQLQGNNNKWSLTDFTLSSSGDDSPLIVDARGQLQDFTGKVEARLKADYQLRDPALLESISGLRTRAAKGELELNSSNGITEASGNSTIGETNIRYQGKISHGDGNIRALTLVLDSPMLTLEDLGLQAKADTSSSYNPSEQLEDLEPGERFERALAQAPRFDTDVTVNLDGISGENTNIESFHLHFTGQEQRYTLRRLSIAYDQSQSEARGIIDLNARPPFVSLAVDAVAVPIDTLATDLGLDLDVSGIANLRGGISSQGTNPKQLLAEVDGNIGLALQDAVIEGAAYDVLATDLLAWFYSGAALEESTRIDCTMGQFVLVDGVAKSDSLYIETRKMVATGSAKLDFGKQSMDLKFTPRSKTRKLQVPSSIRIRGPFNDPKVIISPVTAAFDAYAEVLSLVPQMARRIFGGDRRRKSQRPCDPGSR